MSIELKDRLWGNTPQELAEIQAILFQLQVRADRAEELEAIIEELRDDLSRWVERIGPQ